MIGINGDLLFCLFYVDFVDEVECDVLDLVQVVVVIEQRIKVVLTAVEDVGYALSDIDLALYVDVFEGLFSELVLAEGAVTARNGTFVWAMGEDAVHTGLAHLVVAFWVDQKAHGLVEIA